MSSGRRLLFVYNADAGLFNTVADIGHKLFSPATYPCRLCALTHGYFTTSAQWKHFVAGLPVPCEFLHRDEFLRRYPGMDIRLPAVLLEEAGALLPCLSVADLDACHDLAALEELILGKCCGGDTPA